MSDAPPSERPTPTQPLERRRALPLEERVAQLEVLLERVEGRSATSSAELLERQQHLDECIDEVKVEVRAHGQRLQEQGTQLREHGNLIRGIRSNLLDVSAAVHRAAWATPAATTSGVGAVAAGVMALGRLFGWW